MPHEAHQAIGPTRCDFRRRAQVTPALVEQLEIGRIIVLDGLEQLFEPFLTHCPVGGRLRDDGNERVDGGARYAAECTR